MLLVLSNKRKKIIATSTAAVILLAIFSLTTLASSTNTKINPNESKITKTETTVTTPSLSPTKVMIARKTATNNDSLVQSKSDSNTNQTVPTTMQATQNPSPITSSPTPTVIPATPTPTSSPTPTPNLSPMIKGRSLTEGGNSASFPNMKVKITHDPSGAAKESTSGNFEFTNLTPGTYKVEVQAVEGYSIWHSVCFDCESSDHYYNNATFYMNITENHKVIGITIKYLP